LYECLLSELPSLGGTAFLAVRAAYAQLRQLAYVKSRLHDRYEGKSPDRADNLFSSYVAALSQGVARLDSAISTLRSRAPRVVFRAELPALTDLTEIEQLFYRREGN